MTNKQFQSDIPILVLWLEINLHQEYKNDNLIPVSLILTCIFVKPNDIYDYEYVYCRLIFLNTRQGTGKGFHHK